MFKPVLNQGAQIWLDYILGYAGTEAKLLDVMETVLVRCEIFGVRLHPKKCFFSSFETVWCGKNISGKGVSHCAEQVCEMRRPITAADLQLGF